VSRTDARSNKLRRRPARAVPATIVSLVLLAAGVGLVWITVLRLLNGRWPAFMGSFHNWLAALTWGSAIAIAISLAAVALGLILLVCAGKPVQMNAMVLQPDHSSDAAGTTDFVMTRRSVARLATSHADQVDGVDSVSVTVTARRVALSVKSPSERRSQLAETVSARVREALQGAGLRPMPKVTTTVRTKQL
jgi:hypothetical protein